MSRSNPSKNKKRKANKTVLFYGEGLAEEVFLKYLRSLYAYNTGVKVTVRNNKGGDPVSMVINASNEPGLFNRKIVVLDNDKKEIKQAIVEAKRNKIKIIESSPCLESTLLSILRPGKKYSDKTSSWCKHEFEAKYLNKKRRVDIGEYEKFFPKSVLDDARIRVKELDTIIAEMEQ